MVAIAVSELRMYLGERIPASGVEQDTLFTEEELATIIARGEGNLYLTLGHAWNAKAGILSELIDIAEDGSTRALSKRYEQARRQADANYKKAVEEDASLASQVPPVVGKGFDAFPPNADEASSYIFHHTPVTWP